MSFPQLYAIVGSWERAIFLAQAKVPYLQLRFKGQSLTPYLPALSQWQQTYPQTRLIINDDPELALKIGAWGVHLGQEDLAAYRPEDFRASPLKLGISTHSWQEIALAETFQPAYLGFGPIFPTQTKTLAFEPQGVERLREVVALLRLPIVAIGGINWENLAQVASASPHAIAMISALDQWKTPKDYARWKVLLNDPCPPSSPRDLEAL